MAEADAVSLRRFAALQGWNPGHAHRLKVAGRLVLVVDEAGRELVHVAKSLARIAESSDPQKGYMSAVNAKQREQAAAAAAVSQGLSQGATNAPAKPPTNAPAEATEAPTNAPTNAPAEAPAIRPSAAAILASDSEAPGQQSRNATYNQARTAREVYEAKLAQLKYEQEVGRLVNADEVRAEFAKQIVVVRDQFLRLPDRLAPMLVGLADIETIKRTIMLEVRTALTQFTGAA